MPLIEPPISANGNPHQVHLVQRQPESPDRALEDRSEGDIEGKILLPENRACLSRLFLALFR
jgi:hypothetical protein